MVYVWRILNLNYFEDNFNLLFKLNKPSFFFVRNVNIFYVKVTQSSVKIHAGSSKLKKRVAQSSWVGNKRTVF